MRKSLLPLFLLAVVPAAAQAEQPVRFEQDGSRFEYVVTDRADGSRLISGRNLTANQNFQLLVRGDRVSGTFGGSAVAFQAPVAKQTRLASK